RRSRHRHHRHRQRGDSAKLNATILPSAHCHRLSRVREIVESDELAGCCQEPRWLQSIRHSSYVARSAPDLEIRTQPLIKIERIAPFLVSQVTSALALGRDQTCYVGSERTLDPAEESYTN